MELLFIKIELLNNLIYVFFKKAYYKLKYGKKVNFGKNVNFRRGFKLYISGNSYVEIGDNTFFNQYCSVICMNKIIIGKDNLFAEGVKIYDHNHVFNNMKINRGNKFTTRDIVIGNNNWFGTYNVILSKSNIGNNNVFGAGVVINSTFDNDCVIKCDCKYDIDNINYKNLNKE